MNALPVIMRELRAESRRPFNYWLRVFAGGVLLLGFAWALWQLKSSAGQLSRFGAMASAPSPRLLGLHLFGTLNAVIFTTIWILGPLMTADAVARERREGTLGLLFLTPLTSAEIMMAKACVHMLRGVTLFLAMLPWLAIPILLGGVDYKDGLMALLLNSTSLILALGAGLLASCWARDQVKAMLLAELIAFIFFLLFAGENSDALRTAALTNAPPTIGGNRFRSIETWVDYELLGSHSGWLRTVTSLFTLATNAGIKVTPTWLFGMSNPEWNVESGWGRFWTDFPPAAHRDWFIANAQLAALALIAFLVVVWLASFRLRYAWREQPKTARQEELERKLYTPRYWQDWLRRRTRTSLDRNPIGWLHHYSPRARITKWSWCLAVLLVEIGLTGNVNDVYAGQTWVATVLLFALAFSAAASFRRERETGALELLLVSPLNVTRIIIGRVLGIWTQFLPAGLILVGCSVFLGLQGAKPLGGARLPLTFIVTSFLCLPVIGMYFSMTRWHVIASWLWTCFLGLGLPWLFFSFGDRSINPGMPTFGASGELDIRTGFAIQFTVAGACGVALWRNLKARTFCVR